MKQAAQKKANLFLLTGENTFELQRFRRAWQAKALEKYGEFNVSDVDVIERPIGEILGEMNSPPFFGDGKRIFFLSNFPPPAGGRAPSAQKKTEFEALIAALKQLDDDTVVICIVPKPDKRMSAYKQLIKIVGKVHEFTAWEKSHSGSLSPAGKQAAVAWVDQESKGMVKGEAARFLVDYCGDDPWKLHNEIKKLALLSGKRHITPELIELVCVPTNEMMNFAFSNAVQSQNIKRILDTFDELCNAGDAPQAIVARDIVPTIRQLLLVKLTLDAGKTAADAKIHPFVFNKLKEVARNFALPDLFSAHQSILHLDFDSKRGKVPLTTDKIDMFKLRIEQVFLRLFSKIPQLKTNTL
jgi:DNA polymerase-3 subunit delta